MLNAMRTLRLDAKRSDSTVRTRVFQPTRRHMIALLAAAIAEITSRKPALQAGGALEAASIESSRSSTEHLLAPGTGTCARVPSREPQSECLRSLTFIGDYPKNSNNGWHTNVQGVARDEEYWYITQQNRLWKIPISHNLNAAVDGSEPLISLVELEELPLRSEGYDHFGDLDQYDGRLYVALEGRNAGLIPAVAVFSAVDLSFETYRLLDAQSHLADQCKMAPWCAINPVDGLLYSSSFFISGFGPCPESGGCDAHSVIYKYDVGTGLQSESDGSRAELAGHLTLTDEIGYEITLCRIQGGAFSSTGNLYLVSDTKAGGIYGFDGQTGRMILHTIIDYDPEDREELEGITVWEQDSDAAIGITGQVHVLMIDEHPDRDDDLYFKHFRVDPSSCRF
jgi:hypothetical protein